MKALYNHSASAVLQIKPVHGSKIAFHVQCSINKTEFLTVSKPIVVKLTDFRSASDD